MRHQEIVFNLLGQSFTYDPPEYGRPSGTPTVTVYATGSDDDTETESAAGACTVDSVNTTLDESADAGTKSLTVVSDASFVRGRRYLLTDTNGEQEWFECYGVASNVVTTRQPLINSYSNGATIVGNRITASVDSTWVADASNITDVLAETSHITQFAADSWAPGAAGYRLRWSYTVNGVATIGVSYADLVRYQAKNLVTPLDVDRTFPGWIDRLATDYRDDQGAALVDEAFGAVKMDALADAQLLRRIRDTQVLSELVKYRANMLAVQNDVIRGRLSDSSLTVAQNLYTQRYNALVREPKVAVDQTGGGSNGEAARLPAWRR